MLKRMFVSAFAILAMTTAMVASAADTPAALNFKAKDIDGKEVICPNTRGALYWLLILQVAEV